MKPASFISSALKPFFPFAATDAPESGGCGRMHTPPVSLLCTPDFRRDYRVTTSQKSDFSGTVCTKSTANYRKLQNDI